MKYLVIHSTATPEGRPVTGADIRHWHLSPPPQGRGWKQVGYTDLFRLDGSVERLVENNEDSVVDPWEITNGAAGYNAVSRHIVYAGGVDAHNPKKPKDTRTPAQKDAMARYVRAFHRKHPDVIIVGHCELNPLKACPSFSVKKWLESIGIHQ